MPNLISIEIRTWLFGHLNIWVLGTSVLFPGVLKWTLYLHSGFKDVTAPTNARSMIASALIPWLRIAGNTLPAIVS